MIFSHVSAPVTNVSSCTFSMEIYARVIDSAIKAQRLSFKNIDFTILYPR
jgi:hypothetical protein